MKNIILLSTSIREGSYNSKLVNIIKSISENFQLVSLRDYELSIYNGDLEEKNGVPKKAQELHQIFLQSSGMIVSTAEYNGSYPALIKNTIDWVSRVNLQCFQHKPVLIVSASPSAFGGAHAALMLKNLFSAVGAIIYPSRFCVPHAYDAFNEDGTLKDRQTHENLQKLVNTFCESI